MIECSGFSPSGAVVGFAAAVDLGDDVITRFEKGRGAGFFDGADEYFAYQSFGGEERQRDRVRGLGGLRGGTTLPLQLILMVFEFF